MHHGAKSDILECIYPCRETEWTKPLTTAVIIDCAMGVHMLRPKDATTFLEYFDNIFSDYVLGWFNSHTRVDVVFDVYSELSIKSGLREVRGSGSRMKVAPSAKIPRKWHNFLKVSENKQELFCLLAERMKCVMLPQVYLHCIWLLILLYFCFTG